MYTIDTIPAKTFFRVQQTGDLTLLSTEKKTNKELYDAWEEIVKKDQEITGNKKSNRIINLTTKIERLNLELETLSAVITSLKNERNSDLETILKESDYKLTEKNFAQDLETAQRQIKSIKVRISRFENELKRLLPTENQQKQETFEDILVNIFTVLEIGLVDANTITLLYFRSLEKQAVRKIEALQKSK